MKTVNYYLYNSASDVSVGEFSMNSEIDTVNSVTADSTVADALNKLVFNVDI